MIQHDALVESLGNGKENVSNAIGSKMDGDDPHYALYLQETQTTLASLVQTIEYLCAATGYIVNMSGSIAVPIVISRVLLPVLKPWMRRQPGKAFSSASSLSPSSVSTSMSMCVNTMRNDTRSEEYEWTMWRCSACLLADIVEFGGGAFDIAGVFFTSALTYSRSRWFNSSTNSLSINCISNIGTAERGFLQAALYGLGSLMERKPSSKTLLSTASLLPSLLQSLVKMQTIFEEQLKNGKGLPSTAIEEPEASFGYALDNGIAALGKLIMRHQQQHQSLLPLDKIAHLIPIWMNLLPLRFDEEEGIVAHAHYANALFSPLFRAFLSNSSGLADVACVGFEVGY